MEVQTEIKVETLEDNYCISKKASKVWSVEMTLPKQAPDWVEL